MSDSERDIIRAHILSACPTLETGIDGELNFLLDRAVARWQRGASMGEIVMYVHKDIAALMGNFWYGQEYKYAPDRTDDDE